MVKCLSAHVAANRRQHPLRHTCHWNRLSLVTCAEPADEERGRAPVEEYNTWPATAPPRRRLIVGLSTAGVVALAANFLGSTSFLLGSGDGKLANALKLDTLYPVNGLKRVEQAELSRGLDFQDIDQMERAARNRAIVQPSIAFGPPGGSGVDNISIITAPSPGLRLQELGSPENVAQFLLNNQLAPPGRGKIANLINSSSYTDTRGVVYYSLEYQVRKEGTDGWQRHNLAVLAAQQGVLYTFNAQCDEARWTSDRGPLFRRSAASFSLQAR